MMYSYPKNEWKLNISKPLNLTISSHKRKEEQHHQMSGNNQRNVNMDWLYSLERASKIIWYLEFPLKYSGEKNLVGAEKFATLLKLADGFMLLHYAILLNSSVPLEIPIIKNHKKKCNYYPLFNASRKF